MADRSKVYVGDTGTAIKLDTEAVLSGATALSIMALKPDGTTVEWPATAVDTSVQRLTAAADLDVPGTWRLQAKVVNPSGEWLGETVKLKVYPAFR